MKKTGIKIFTIIVLCLVSSTIKAQDCSTLDPIAFIKNNSDWKWWLNGDEGASDNSWVDQQCNMWTVKTDNNSPYHIRSPWASASRINSIIGISEAKDYLKSKGWELIRRDFGAVTRPRNKPYFILYNKFSGVLRIFLYNTPNGSENTFNSYVIKLKLARNNKLTTVNAFSLDKLPAQDKINSNTPNSEIGQNMVSYYVSEKNSISKGVWLVGEFEMAFDSNVQNLTNTYLQFEVIGSTESDLSASIKGRSCAGPTSRCEPILFGGDEQLIDDSGGRKVIGNLQGIVKGGKKAIKGGPKAIEFIEKQIDKKIDRVIAKGIAGYGDGLLKAQSTIGGLRSITNGTSKLKTILEKAIEAAGPVGKALSAVSNIAGFLGIKGFGPSPPPITVTDYNFTLSGTIKTDVPFDIIDFKVPGSQSPFNEPVNSANYYDCPLGIGYLENTPRLRAIKYARATGKVRTIQGHLGRDNTTYERDNYYSLRVENDLQFNYNTLGAKPEILVSIGAKVNHKFIVNSNVFRSIVQKYQYGKETGFLRGSILKGSRSKQQFNLLEYEMSVNSLNMIDHISTGENKGYDIYITPPKPIKNFKGTAINVPADGTELWLEVIAIYENGYIKKHRYMVDLNESIVPFSNEYIDGLSKSTNIFMLPPYRNYTNIFGTGFFDSVIESQKLPKISRRSGKNKAKPQPSLTATNQLVFKNVEMNYNREYLSSTKKTPSIFIAGNEIRLQNNFVARVGNTKNEIVFKTVNEYNRDKLKGNSVVVPFKTSDDCYNESSLSAKQLNVENSITEINGKGIVVYPSPAKSNVNISFSSYYKGTNVYLRILNSTGKVVHQLHTSITEDNQIMNIDVSNLSSGLYIVEVLDGLTSVEKKLIIK